MSTTCRSGRPSRHPGQGRPSARATPVPLAIRSPRRAASSASRPEAIATRPPRIRPVPRHAHQLATAKGIPHRGQHRVAARRQGGHRRWRAPRRSPPGAHPVQLSRMPRHTAGRPGVTPAPPLPGQMGPAAQTSRQSCLNTRARLPLPLGQPQSRSPPGRRAQPLQPAATRTPPGQISASRPGAAGERARLPSPAPHTHPGATSRHPGLLIPNAQPLSCLATGPGLSPPQPRRSPAVSTGTKSPKPHWWLN
jgi:hypothetical protein